MGHSGIGSRIPTPINFQSCDPADIMKVMSELSRRGCHLSVYKDGTPIAYCKSTLDRILDVSKVVGVGIPLAIAIIKK